MESLPYRATVFLRPTDGQRHGGHDGCDGCVGDGHLLHGLGVQAGGRPGSLDLMERSFAREADAVQWCNVMSEAEPQATGAWFVAVSRGGRMMRITREVGLGGIGMEPVGGAADELGDVLAAAGLPAGPDLTAPPVRLEPVGSA